MDRPNQIRQLRLSNRGVAFFVVLSVVSVMGIFILFYNTFSRQFASSNFYHVNRDKLKNITDIIMSSTFVYIQDETRDETSTLSKEIVNSMKSGAATNFVLKAPMFENVKADLLNGLAIDYSIKGSVFDKRTKNPKGHKYYTGEGLGTLEVELTANLKTNSGKILAACSRKRHFDFKSSCLVSNYNNRKNSYAMSFPLDYALLIRDARREFNERPNGQNFNAGTKFSIANQSSIAEANRGWVHFGSANSNTPNNRIALNIDDTPESAKLLPSLPATKFEVNQDECYKLIPSIKTDLAAEGVTLSGLKGYFKYYVLPAPKTGNNNAEITQNNLETAPNGICYQTKAPAIKFEGPQTESYLKTILRGAITKRFLYMVHFILDPSNTKATSKKGTDDLDAKAKLALINKGNFICHSPDSDFLKIPSVANSNNGKKLIRYAKAVKDIQQRLSPTSSLYSEMKENNLFFEGQSLLETETPGNIFGSEQNFYARNGSRLSSISATGGDGFRPFRHCTLYSARFYHAKELESSGVYDKKNGILNLRGLISVELDTVILTPPSGKTSIMVKGKGAILAPHGFRIQAGITLEDPSKDMCIFFTRKGNIKITTDQPIHASLMAFNDSNSGSISAFKPLDIHGSVGVDRLYSSRLPNTVSKITYNKRFKVNQDNNEIFSITISPWIRFEHINYSRNKINAT